MVPYGQLMPINRYLDLSTGHITQEEMEAMLEAAHRRVGSESDDSILPTLILHDYGAWVHVPDPDLEPEGETSRAERFPNLQAVIELARANECAWINLDSDAKTEDSLPTFEW